MGEPAAGLALEGAGRSQPEDRSREGVAAVGENHERPGPVEPREQLLLHRRADDVFGERGIFKATWKYFQKVNFALNLRTKS